MQFTARHVRGRPRPPCWHPGWPLYVCDSRYNDRERVFVKIKNWNSCIPEEVRKKEEFMPIYQFERPVYPRRFPSPFVAAPKLKAPGGIIEPPAEKTEKGESKKSKAIDDDFFDAGSESESDGMEEENGTGARKDIKSKKNSRNKLEESEPQAEVRPATEAELELLVAPDDVSTASHKNHFDMKAILKAEKAKGKKRGKKNKKKGGREEDEDIQEDFRIDVKDDRFKALHEDHTFAIDPSNPQYVRFLSSSFCSRWLKNVFAASRRRRACLRCWKSVLRDR